MAVRHLIGALTLALLACGGGGGPSGAVSPEQARASQGAQAWTFHEESGATVSLAKWRGKTVVLSAIYTTCNKVCPRTVAKLRQVERAFQGAGKPVELVLVSLDPEHDTPEQLRAYKEETKLGDNWHLLQGSRATTQAVTDLLDMHTLTMDEHIMHESRILVLDGDGRARRSFECCGFDERSALF